MSRFARALWVGWGIGDADTVHDLAEAYRVFEAAWVAEHGDDRPLPGFNDVMVPLMARMGLQTPPEVLRPAQIEVARILDERVAAWS